MGGRVYACIDMKTFYASVECAERRLNPFETDLVVADPSRGKNALCLAVSPHLKQQGVKNRCRLSDIPAHIRYRIAPPRMQLYIHYAARIYDMYLKFFSKDDIYVYSIDESFIDLTDYLRVYRTDAETLAAGLIRQISERFLIPAAAGVGTNLFLAKVALDLLAKHDRSHVAYLDENVFQQKLGSHRPITDFWQIAAGTAARLARHGVYDMNGVRSLPVDVLFRVFGKDAELLLDHASGRESCRIEDIRNYRPTRQSVSFSQILPKNYSSADARLIVSEMAVYGAEELMRRQLIAKKINLYIGFAIGTQSPQKGSVRMPFATQVGSLILEHAQALYDRLDTSNGNIRQIGISFEDVCAQGCEGYDIFTDFERIERERALQRTAVDIHDRFGKNSLLRGFNLAPGAMQRERNLLIGGHRADGAKSDGTGS